MGSKGFCVGWFGLLWKVVVVFYLSYVVTFELLTHLFVNILNGYSPDAVFWVGAVTIESS